MHNSDRERRKEQNNILKEDTYDRELKDDPNNAVKEANSDR